MADEQKTPQAGGTGASAKSDTPIARTKPRSPMNTHNNFKTLKSICSMLSTQNRQT